MKTPLPENEGSGAPPARNLATANTSVPAFELPYPATTTRPSGWSATSVTAADDAPGIGVDEIPPLPYVSRRSPPCVRATVMKLVFTLVPMMKDPSSRRTIPLTFAEPPTATVVDPPEPNAKSTSLMSATAAPCPSSAQTAATAMTIGRA